MTFKCSVPGCRSNYDNEKGKYTVFSFPKNEALLRRWVNAMPTENFQCHKHSKVCELHFEPGQIIREASGYDGRKKRVLTAPLTNPRLQKDAIPTRFASPGFPLKPEKRRIKRKIKRKKNQPKKKTRKAENIKTIGCRRLAKILMTESGFESLEIDEPSSAIRELDEANTNVPNVIYLNKLVRSSSSSSLTSSSPLPCTAPLTSSSLSSSCLQFSSSLSSVVSHTSTVAESHNESSIVSEQELAETTSEPPQVVFDNIPFVKEFAPSSSTSSISCSLPSSSSSLLTSSSSVSCSLPSSSNSSLTSSLPLSICAPPSCILPPTSSPSSVVSQAGTGTESQDVAESTVVIKQELVEFTNEPPQMAVDNTPSREEFVPSTSSSSVSCSLPSSNCSSLTSSLPSSRSVPPSRSLHSVVSQAGTRTESQDVAESSVVIKQELVESTNEPPQMAVDNTPYRDEFIPSTSSSSVSSSLPSSNCSSLTSSLPSSRSVPPSSSLSSVVSQAGTRTESQDVAESSVVIKQELVESTNEPPQMAVDNIPFGKEFVPSTSSSSVSCSLPPSINSSLTSSLPSSISSSITSSLPSSISSSITSSLPLTLNLSTVFSQTGAGTESQDAAESPVVIKQEHVESSSKPSPVVVDNILYVKEFIPSSGSSSLPRNLPIFFISSPFPEKGLSIANSDSTIVNETPVANKPKGKRKMNNVKTNTNDSTTCPARAKVRRLAKPRISSKRPNEQQLHSKTNESAGGSITPSDDTPNVTRDILQSLLKDSKNGPLHDSRTSEKPSDLFDVLGSYIAEKLRGMNLDDCALALKSVLDIVSKTGQVQKINRAESSDVPNPE